MTMDLSLILEHTHLVARELRAACAERPLEELTTWLRLAHQRESMVSELYDVAQIERRLASQSGRGRARVVRSAVLWLSRSTGLRRTR